MKRNTDTNTTSPLYAIAIASIAMAGISVSQTTITEDFESTTPPGVPTGWATVGVPDNGTFETTAGTGNPGQSGNVTQTATVTSPVPRVYLVNNGVAFDATRPMSATFDFFVGDGVNNPNYSSTSFIIGDVRNGLADPTAGKFLNFQLQRATFSQRARVWDGLNNQLVNTESNNQYAISANTWISGTFTWTPTSGTTGNFTFTWGTPTIGFTTPISFTFDSPAAYFGFGTMREPGRFDDISITGFPSAGVYWDTNGTTEGAGNPATGTWDGSLTNWNPNADGTASTVAWPAGGLATFSAGNDATEPYTVTVSGTQDFRGLKFDHGTPTLTGGTLRITNESSFAQVSSGLTATIASAITEDAEIRALSKGGGGSLVLSGDLSYTGATTLVGGNLTLSGSNSAATGGTTVTKGILQVDSASSIPGAGENLTINPDGVIVFGPSFGAASIPAALDRIVTTSTGTIAPDNYGPTSFDFSADGANLTAAYLGAVGTVGYSGTLTPNGTTYRLGGGGGTLSMNNVNAISGANALLIRGNVILAENNDYSGATSVAADSSLSLLGSTATSGVVLNAGSALTVGNSGSLGVGTLTISGLATIAAQGTVATANPVAANADFNIGGTGTLTLGTVTVNNNRIITNNNSASTTTLSAIGVTSGNRNLTFNSIGNTTVSGNIITGSGTLAKNDAGTLTLQGANTYSGTTTVSGGTLVLSGSNNSAGTTVVNAAILQLNSNSNGGLASGQITMNQNAAVLQAVNADRVIANAILLNASPTISGSQSLTINGTMTVNNNRTLTNSITGTGKALTFSDITRDGTNNRNLIFSGDGDTIVNGTLVLGSGTLTKNGSGTLTLNNTNTYTGTTTVNNAGTLLVNGDSSASIGNVTVNNTATLGGSGSIGGNVTVTGSANLAPGASVGTLAIGGNLTISAMAGGTGKLVYELGPVASSDRVNVTGDLNIGTGALGFSDFDFTNIGGLEEGVYTLIASGKREGTLDATNLEGTIGGFDVVLGTSGNNIILTVGDPGGTPYELWASVNAPTGNPDDDFDGDGVSNAVEFVLGGDKDANDLDKLPAATTENGNLVFTFVRDQISVDAGVTVQIEVGTDLSTWPDTYTVGADTAGSTAGVTVTDNEDGTDTVTLTVARAPDAAKFARLAVTIAP
jgi:fibronectin-binding autotransporter adhesin